LETKLTTMNVCMLTLGVFGYSVALAAAVAKQCRVDFYCSDYHINLEDPAALDVLEDKCNIYRFRHYRNRDIRNLVPAYRLCMDIRKRHYDVIHVQEYANPWVALWWPICANCPTVVTVHDPFQHYGLPLVTKLYHDAMQAIFVRKADKIIVHGDLLKRQFIERYRAKAEGDVTVVALGDVTLGRKWEKPGNDVETRSKTKTILFFGEVRPNKGLEYLLKAEPLIRRRLSDYEIVIAGKCHHFEPYRKFIEPGAPVRVVNRFIPNAEVPAYFRRASVVVLPYISATQSAIIPMAYAFGKPVVATRVGAMPDVVADGNTGFLVEPGNERALADALVRILSNDDLRREMGENASRYCEVHLNWNVIASKTLAVYEAAIRERHERA